ncbi:DUF1828 domain-containing protein [uncultured Veillonella sp.]|uniref:DUF1828 domain-containing protein n=1 Tax=uncultured Veillonella sp. TaxID=159268 RepID=UPI002619E1E7|nr:DUF1828 domain-containing protein [uncultured Veillonella sp.]
MTNSISMIKAELQNSFAHQFDLIEKRPDIYQLLVPIYHPDGDMVEMFLDLRNKNQIILMDYGMTLMRLSYTFDIDTDKKQQLLQQIIFQYNGNIDYSTGIISTQCNINQLFNAIMQYSQLILKVLSLALVQRKSVANLFYKKFTDYVLTSLKSLNPKVDYKPLSAEQDLVIQYAFEKNNKKVFLFPSSSESKAKDTIIDILTLQQAECIFTSVVVHDSFDKLPRGTQKKIMKVSDKQFYDLADFEESGADYINRILA